MRRKKRHLATRCTCRAHTPCVRHQHSGSQDRIQAEPFVVTKARPRERCSCLRQLEGGQKTHAGKTRPRHHRPTVCACLQDSGIPPGTPKRTRFQSLTCRVKCRTDRLDTALAPPPHSTTRRDTTSGLSVSSLSRPLKSGPSAPATPQQQHSQHHRRTHTRQCEYSKIRGAGARQAFLTSENVNADDGQNRSGAPHGTAVELLAPSGQ